tara:strand:+ start:7215 stop:8030 length:816 start_codon:yes stop_codon:yes gene_type:complete
MIFKNSKIFFIAEAGINHNGSLKQALKLVDAAKRAGASAIKFQTYWTEKRVKKNNPAFNILKKCELNFKEFKTINDYCKKKKIIFFSTPFDLDSIAFLNELKVPMFKIASFDIENYSLINAIVKTKKPTIYSTGMAKLNAIKKLNKILQRKNIEQCILHCVSSYPNKEESSYLSNISYLKENFNCCIGISDHSQKIKVPIYGFLMGARVIEKHFKLLNDHKCVDAPVSLDEKQFSKMISEIEWARKIQGNVKFGIKNEEKSAKIFLRKEIY